MKPEPSTHWIDEGLLIPDLLRNAPQVKVVLDRYGLQGCGGPLGPAETLGFFARAHEVAIEQLLGELREQLGKASEPAKQTPAAPGNTFADTIYRPFFKAGILVVLTLGASWGAYLLMRIGLGGSFRAAGLHEVNAHGHAQIFGWVGLFVMGFAYQVFPRFKHTRLAYPGLAAASLRLMIVGLVGRSVLQPLAQEHGFLIGPAVAASVLEVLAIVLFAVVVLATWRGAGKALAAYDYYILSALVWFVVQAIYESVYLTATLLATGPALTSLVATWQAPLRDIQIHGFALLMILGVSQRLFPHLYGFPNVGQRRSLFVLGCLNLAVLGEAAGLVLMRLFGHGWAVLWYASVLLLTAATALLVAGWRLFAHAEESDRNLKFLRAAYGWLFISLGMLVLLPVYQQVLLPLVAPESPATQLGFSHAYYGAIRHAITVGFVSLMIVGVAAKIVPTLNGVDGRDLPRLWAPFVLINLGCALRVFSQTLTDFVPESFPFTGASGVLEVSGLALWGLHLWSIMSGRLAPRPGSEKGPTATPVVAGQPITGTNLVSDVLDVYPELVETFIAFGFAPLANPLLRRTAARRVTVARACRVMGVEAAAFLATLNAAREKRVRSRTLATVPLSKDQHHGGCSCCEDAGATR
jgi:hypothetical protein